MRTDVTKFIADLSGGVFEEKLAMILSEVASGVIDHAKVGEVNVSFKLKRIGNSYQVEIAHKLSYKVPTANGDRSENNLTTTPMHVGSGGALSLFPEDQHSLFPNKVDVTEQGELENDNG